MEGHPFTFFERWLPDVDQHNLHMVTSTFVVLLLLLGVAILYPRLKDASKNVLPDRRLSLRNLFEVFIDMIAGLCEETMGPAGRRYLPFICTIFFFIFGSNVIGLIPGFLPATENWVTGASVATITFLAFNYFGIREHGLGYFKHFLAPVQAGPAKGVLRWLAIMVPVTLLHMMFGAIEVVSMLFRPLTLSIRLYANIFADHQVLGIFSGLIPYIIPIPFIVLGLFVSFMQAFIFAFLTTVYISGAVAHEHS